MAAFVIFWSAMFAVLFFVLGIIFKGLASAFNALLSSCGGIIAMGGLAALVAIALSLLYAIVDGIVTRGVGEVIGMIVLLMIEIGIFGALVGGLGSLLLSIVTIVAEYLLHATSYVLEGAAAICEKGYAKSLLAIMKRIDKC